MFKEFTKEDYELVSNYYKFHKRPKYNPNEIISETLEVSPEIFRAEMLINEMRLNEERFGKYWKMREEQIRRRESHDVGVF